MTALSVAQGVAKKVGLEVPGELFASIDREFVELRDLMNDAADRVAEGANWQVLSTIATLTGDGTTTAFDLPSDYDRMVPDAQVWSSSLETALTHIMSLDKWLGLDVNSFDFVVNAWTIYGGQMHIKPALANAVTAKFFYQSNLIVTAADTTTQTAFTADDDVFRLDEGLLELATIWRWKAYKGQSYAEELEDYSEKLERLVTRDRGAKMIHMGDVRLPSDVRIAFPQTISG